ncbi:uncharacterized protein VICG_00763 [Vittaforma corneae ATCC 50505]|uniref:Uncharacterized protein n=1 Tax=Vittaforma corneae (strain ATCC 50505) TaxID=993615 RepID=L2GP98_VITCO|nr:uncharacterized protein VICG_00763 [Vittaforma corneae ATCC 50505]ELA42122.1 hypothetical protein VICG_00763 [Vittaforma corneae ATCC 50505]
MGFEKVKMELGMSIRPKYLNDPSTSIFKQLCKHLLQYSYNLSGFPLSFTIEGVLPAGKILEDGSVYVDCLVSFYIFRVSPGDVLCSVNGNVCGIFSALVGNEENYTGDIIVKGVDRDKILGMKSAMEEESGF